MTLPWTDDRKPPDVATLTLEELLTVWRENRNGMMGLVAADEVCRRLSEKR